MVQYSHPHLGPAFAALADTTRRGVLEHLARNDASISELASAFDMTLTGMKKHIDVLESAGLVRTRKTGRVRTCSLGADPTAEAAWLDSYRALWATRFAALDRVLADLTQKEATNARKPKS